MDAGTINPIPPSLANLAWRPISQDDLAAVVELARSGFAVDGGITFMFEPENVQERFFPPAPGVSIGACTPDGRLGACASVYLLDAASTQQARIVGLVRPDLRGRSIGDYLLRWSEAQAQVLLAGAAMENSVLQIATESLSQPASNVNSLSRPTNGVGCKGRLLRTCLARAVRMRSYKWVVSGAGISPNSCSSVWRHA